MYDGPLTSTLFFNICRQYRPTILIDNQASEYCDTFTELNIPFHTLYPETSYVRDSVRDNIQRHRDDAAQEFKFYGSLWQSSQHAPHNITFHMILYLAKKILLPHLLRQLGQFQFIIGLHFDVFEVLVSNMNETHIHFFPEGLCPVENTSE